LTSSTSPSRRVRSTPSLLDLEHLAEPARQEHAVVGQHQLAVRGVEQRVKLPAGREALHDGAARLRARHQPHGRGAYGLDAQDARQVLELVEGAVRDRLAEERRGVLARAPEELDVHELVDRVAEEARGHDHGDREHDAEDTEGGAARTPAELAEDHPRARREERADQALEEHGAEGLRGLGPHGLRGRERGGAHDGGQHPAERRREAHGDAEEHDPPVHVKDERGELVVGPVERDELDAEPSAEHEAEHDAEGADDPRELEVMDGDGAPPEAERAQGGDDGPLDPDEPREDGVQEERRHAEEDRRHHARLHRDLIELGHQVPVRELVLPRVGAEPAVGREQIVEPVDHLALVGPVREGQRDAVEGAVEVEGEAEGVLVHPDDAVAPLVGDDLAAAHGEYELWRERDARDVQRREAPVDDGGDRVAGSELVRVGERLVDQHLVGVRGIEVEAAPEDGAVQARDAAPRHR
jgi:hypothetical protein